MSTLAFEIQLAQTDEQILSCFPILKSLRPHLSEEDFVSRIRKQMEEGYHLIYIADEHEVKSAAGYRFADYLAWGKVLYIDDLITLPEARGIGFGTHLTKWLMGEAKKQSCDSLHLDTGIELEDAHRLYLNLGMKIDCLHLSMKL